MIKTKKAVKRHVAKQSRKLLNYIIRPYTESSSADLSLWNHQDARLDQGVFSGNVPSLIINQDQKILDYNSAFHLFFKDFVEGEKSLHISNWYRVLDNFRRLPKRTDNLYGEGLLPITDRNRVVFKSEVYGRCVFTKIMNPLIDRKTAKILGWSIVLNINSISKRQKFFEDLDKVLKNDVAHLRYVTSFDSVISSHGDYQDVLKKHLASVNTDGSVLDLKSHTGELGLRLAAAGSCVSMLESDAEFLRTAKAKLNPHCQQPKMVLRSKRRLYDLPENRFSHVCMTHGIDGNQIQHKDVLKRVYNSLIDGGCLTLSGMDHEVFQNSGEVIENYFKAELKSRKNFDAIKYQFDHTASRYLKSMKSNSINVDELIGFAEKVGFTVEVAERSGWYYFLKFTK